MRAAFSQPVGSETVSYTGRSRPSAVIPGLALILSLLAAPVWPQQPGSVPLMAADAPLSGAFLAGRVAERNHAFAEASEYFARALSLDPMNPAITDALANALVGLGNVEAAVPLAEALDARGQASQALQMVLVTDAFARGDHATAAGRLRDGPVGGPLVDGLALAWALVGEGRMADALDTFDTVIAGSGMSGFGNFHKALALAAAGDVEGAEHILSGAAAGPLPLNRRGLVARLQILSQLDRHEDAAGLIDTAFGTDLDPELAELRRALLAGETLAFDLVVQASDGLAEVYFMLAEALRNEAAPEYTLLFTRLAEFLRPDHVTAILLSAQLLDRLEQHELAARSYERVPPEHAQFHIARTGLAESLYSAGRGEDAIDALFALTETHGQFASVHTALGDLLRRESRFDEASEAYDRAIDLLGEPHPRHWFVYYTRAITHERVSRWELAEADFRKALELNPDQPHVLNYLGYSLVERREKLDEALDMIERAVAGEPDNGYITDSLGWVLYRLGRYEEAVEHMERAVELRPQDAIINDHLGDVYWAVGRKLEARFQWRRALSLGPADDLDMDRVRRKLEVGLDQVLIDEGADPHHSAAGHAD